MFRYQVRVQGKLHLFSRSAASPTSHQHHPSPTLTLTDARAIRRQGHGASTMSTRHAIRSTAMMGFLGLGVGVNFVGTYYILSHTGADLPGMPARSAEEGNGDKTGARTSKGRVTAGGTAEKATPGDKKRRWGIFW